MSVIVQDVAIMLSYKMYHMCRIITVYEQEGCERRFNITAGESLLFFSDAFNSFNWSADPRLPDRKLQFLSVSCRNLICILGLIGRLVGTNWGVEIL